MVAVLLGCERACRCECRLPFADVVSVLPVICQPIAHWSPCLSVLRVRMSTACWMPACLPQVPDSACLPGGPPLHLYLQALTSTAWWML